MARFPTLTRWAERFAAKAAPKDLMTPTAVWTLVDSLFSFDDPDEIMRKAGKDRTELRKVAADDEVATALDTRLAALLATPWRLEPAEFKGADFIWAQLERHADSIIESAWAATLYGYSVIERIYARDADGMLVVDQVHERPFEWFAPDRNGRLVIRAGIENSGEVVDTVDKFILTRNRPTWRNPKGEALLSRCYWPWFLRSAGWRMWARFLERNASPLMVGKGNNTKTLSEALAAAVNSGVIAVGVNESVERVDAGQRGEAYQQFSDQVDKRIQKAILGQTLTTDVGDSGSYAAAKVHDLVRMDRRMADVRLVEPALQVFVDSLMRYNFPGVESPRVRLQDNAGLEKARAERDALLAETGQVRFTLEYFLNRYDFEEGEIEVIDPATAPQQPRAKLGAKFSTHVQAHRKQQAIDELADQAIEASGSPIDPAAIRAAVKAAASPEDLINRLEDLAGHLPARAFTELVERSMFAAGVLGYAQEDQGA